MKEGRIGFLLLLLKISDSLNKKRKFSLAVPITQEKAAFGIRFKGRADEIKDFFFTYSCPQFSF